MNALISFYRDAVDSINRRLRMINEKYVDDDLLQDDDAKNRYNQEIVKTINENLLNIAVYRGFSRSRAATLLVAYNPTSGMYDLTPGSSESLFMEPERDKRGYVVRVWLPEAYLEQSEKTDKFLSHYGVRGMKWGVRRSPAEIAKASGDAKASQKIRDTAKSSGTDALTNKQLQTAINRMNLEVNYSRLNDQTRKKSVGEKAVKFLMKDVAEVEVKRVVKGKAAIEVEKTLAKRGQSDLADRIKPKKKK